MRAPLPQVRSTQSSTASASARCASRQRRAYASSSYTLARRSASARALRRLASGVDDWPVTPPALFVVEERAVYLRSRSPMTVAHEFAHALGFA